MSSPSQATKPKKSDCRGNHPCNAEEINIGVTAEGGDAYAQGGAAFNSTIVKVGGSDPTAYGGAGGEGGDSHADSSSSSSSESESDSAAESSASNALTINNNRPSDLTVRNVASPDTPNVYPSAPCRIAVSAGLSLAGGALSGGSSYEDPECTLRETARTFQYLGVPEVGLIVLCQNSVVINGRRDKKGNLAQNEPTPIGTAECLRLVREFQGDGTDDDSGGVDATTSQELREQHDRIERQLTEKVDSIEKQLAEQEKEHQAVVATVRARPVVKEVIHQPYLSEEKKEKLAAVISEGEEAQ